MAFIARETTSSQVRFAPDPKLREFVNPVTWKESYNDGLTLRHYDRNGNPINESIEDEDTLAYLERKAFNRLGYIPAISNLTAVLRASIGAVSMLEGIADFSFYGSYFFYCTAKDAYKNYFENRTISIVDLFDEKQMTDERWDIRRKTVNSIRYFSHGMANFGRSLVEFVPIFGNLACWAYDRAGFRFRYNPADVARTMVSVHGSGENVARSKSQMKISSSV